MSSFSHLTIKSLPPVLPVSHLTINQIKMKSEDLPSHRKKAIDELLRGRQVANQLQLVLNKSTGDDDSLSALDLITSILNSFANTLSILNSVVDSDEVSQFPVSTQLGSPCSDGRKSLEDSGESSKSVSTVNDRRGCYKRRKTSHSWTKETPALVEDGHQWRKYGQKAILNSKYPRNYYRCTHKYDQGCQATKQVQQIQDDPPLHRTTYCGHHTCKDVVLFNATHHLLLDSTHQMDSSMLLSFDSKQNDDQQYHPFLSSSSLVKQEYNNNQSSSSNYLALSPSCHHHHHLPSGSTIDHGGEMISSCATSSHSLDIDIHDIMGPVDFEDDVLQYEF